MKDRMRVASGRVEVLWHLCVAGYLYHICFDTAGFTDEKLRQALAFVVLDVLAVAFLTLYHKGLPGKVVGSLLVLASGGAVVAVWVRAGFGLPLMACFLCINVLVKVAQAARAITYGAKKRVPLLAGSILILCLSAFVGLVILAPVFRVVVVDVMESPRPELYAREDGYMTLVVLAGTYFLISAAFSVFSVLAERTRLREKRRVSPSDVDFFEMQKRSRRATIVLVAYFLATVLVIICSVYFVIVFVFWDSEGGMGFNRLWNPWLFAGITGVTAGSVFTSSAIRMKRLSRGGAALAALLGARPVYPNTSELAERKLLDVIEEMAVASGTPVPLAFVLDEERSINALTGGMTPADAAVIVTAPCIRMLNRSELQGLIAHEFSHILNGDIRLNLRLMGMLHGLSAIWTLGVCLVAGISSRGGPATSKKDVKVPPVLFFAGIPLMVLGAIGMLAAAFIKALISWEREYLADAAALQFTRYPEGIAGALKKIGGFVPGSRIRDPRAAEASHMFFANPRGRGRVVFSTHPSLEDRVRRIDPSFKGRFKLVKQEAPETEAGEGAKAEGGAASPAGRFDASLGMAGSFSPEHLVCAAGVLAGLPAALASSARDSEKAPGVILGMLLSGDGAVRQAQLEQLDRSEREDVCESARQTYESVKDLSADRRLSLAQLAVSALKRLPAQRCRAFVESMRMLIDADERMDLFEYLLMRMVQQQLEQRFGGGRRSGTWRLKPQLGSYVDFLSIVAYWISESREDAVRAFARGMETLGFSRAKIRPPETCSSKTIDRVLGDFINASMDDRKGVLQACLACVTADGKVTIEEAEMLRALAVSLECPLPPVVPT